jgi:predicted DNA-binding ribbon-helix-helix protein
MLMERVIQIALGRKRYPTMFTKHSVQIGGRIINVRMEEQFWESLRDIAADRDTTLPALLKQIADEAECKLDGRRLASILRVYVLEEVMLERSSASTRLKKRHAVRSPS